MSSAAPTTSAEPWEAVKVRHYINNKVVYPKAEFLDYLEIQDHQHYQRAGTMSPPREMACWRNRGLARCR